jgi:transposase
VSATGERQWEQRWPTTDAGIAGLLTRCDATSALAVEASSPTWAFVDRVVGHVGQVQVVDPRKTRLKAGYAAKTDRLDARRLADALRRDSVVGIYYPPPAVRDLRELCRYRCHLARVQASLKQRVHALLLRHAVTIPVRGLFTQRGLRWLATVRLAGWAGASLDGWQRLLNDLRGHLAPALRAIQAEAIADPIARAIATRPGFGPVFSVTVRAEIGTIERFPDGPHLASYAGVVPRIAHSGGRQWSGHITKAGSPWLRWVLIEASLHQFRRQDAFGRWARQLAMRKGILKARVAVARALCDEIVATWPRA